MIINHPASEPKIIEEWDFNFGNGSQLSITVDRKAGDSCQFTSEIIPNTPTVYFSLIEKPSPIDPEGKLDPEEVYVPIANVLCIRRRLRAVHEPSLEEREEWQHVLRELSGPGPTIQH